VGLINGLQSIDDCVLVTSSTLGGKSLKVCRKRTVSVIIIIQNIVLRYSTCLAQKCICYGQNIADGIGTGYVLEYKGSYYCGSKIFLNPSEQL